jgi:hypothetical protein
VTRLSFLLHFGHSGEYVSYVSYYDTSLIP